VTAEFLRSTLLDAAGFRHAFFTRRGGYSPAPLDSLDFSGSSTGADGLANLNAAARVLGIDAAHLYWVSQVHGREVVVVHGEENRGDVLARKADVVVASSAEVASGVKVADCVPLLVGDRASGVVAAIHSGWQGTARNVVAAAIAGLRQVSGHRGEWVAAIGPHIEVCCFEVGEDVAQQLAACAPERTTVQRSPGRRPHVDLRTIVRAQLVAAGVADDAIEDVKGCTKCDATRFFSYRRDGQRSGRLLAAIVARAPRIRREQTS